MSQTFLYTDSVLLSGGVDLLAPPDPNRVVLRIFSLSPFLIQVGPPESFHGNNAMFPLAGNTPLDLLFSKLGPLVQMQFSVFGAAGGRVNAISVDV